MSYVDKFGMYNLKPCVDGDPSGNDGPIITAYAHELGMPVRFDLIKGYFSLLKRNGGKIPVERLPNKETPFPSRDTILGWYWLGLIRVDDLIEAKWIFSPFEIPKFNLVKFLCQSTLCLYEHRNYFWMKEFSQIYRMAFSVPWQDRAYILRDSGRDVPWKYSIYEFFSGLVSSKSFSGKMISWRKGKNVFLTDEDLAQLPFYK